MSMMIRTRSHLNFEHGDHKDRDIRVMMLVMMMSSGLYDHQSRMMNQGGGCVIWVTLLMSLTIRMMMVMRVIMILLLMIRMMNQGCMTMGPG